MPKKVKKVKRLKDLSQTQQDTLALDIWIQLPDHYKTALIDSWMMITGASSVGLQQMANLLMAVYKKDPIVVETLRAHFILDNYYRNNRKQRPGFMNS